MAASTAALSANQAKGLPVPYLLRDLVIDHPNQTWATDVTYIPMARSFVCHVTIMDWRSHQHGWQGLWVDNVFVERLWRSVKYEEVYLKPMAASLMHGCHWVGTFRGDCRGGYPSTWPIQRPENLCPRNPQKSPSLGRASHRKRTISSPCFSADDSQYQQHRCRAARGWPERAPNHSQARMPLRNLRWGQTGRCPLQSWDLQTSSP